MSKQRCEQLANKLGAVITEPDYLRLEAPSGKTFDGDVHEQVYYYGEGDKAGAWKDLLIDLRFMDRMGGFPVCQKKFDFQECEWCDEATAKVGA
jgi:hypothetical protein